jgi:hypothetical protein
VLAPEESDIEASIAGPPSVFAASTMAPPSVEPVAPPLRSN